MKKIVFMLMFLITYLVNPSSIFAGTGPFFVLYDHHPEEKGDVEIMLMTDFVKASVGRDNIAQMLEIEYGVTDQWTTELMIEGQKTFGDTWLYTGLRLENRYRLFMEDLPVNPMVYTELEILNGATKYKMEVSGFRNLNPEHNEEAKKEKELILETRLILGKDFGPWTVAFNWINESDTRNQWETAFGYAIGASYTFKPVYSEKSMNEQKGHDHHAKNGVSMSMSQWVVGGEIYGALGDSEKFGLYSDKQEHYIAPVIQFMRNFSRGMMHINISPAIGLTAASDKFLLRTSIGFEF